MKSQRTPILSSDSNQAMATLSIASIHTIALCAAVFFGTTVYAFCLLFAAVIMPGLDSLEDDAAYLHAFQAIDGRIQNNEPWFVLSWMGSMISPIALAAVTLRLSLPPRRRAILVLSSLLFFVGHITTFAKNIPLNNKLHGMDLDQASETTLSNMRDDFSGPWCAWNVVRTILFGTVSLYWLVVLLHTDTPNDFKKGNNGGSFETPPEVEAHRFDQVI
jgi:uncharacterized membrane protein